MTVIFSQSNDVQFGSFHYPLGLVEHSVTGELSEFMTKILSGEDVIPEGLDQDELTDLAYATFSLFHEARHLFDQFGTIAGISIFSAYIECVKSFHYAIMRIRADGGGWRWPVFEWTKDDDCPLEVRQFVRMARSYRVGSNAFIGAFEPLVAAGYLNEIFMAVPTMDGQEIKAGLIRMKRIHQGEEVPFTVIYPIGMEVTLEANAHAISRSLVEHIFPPSVVERFRHEKFEVPSDEDLGAGVMPYMVLDLIISRYMREKGRPQFYRNLVLGLADEMLGRSVIHIEHVSDRQTKLEAIKLGDILEQQLEAGDVDEFADGKVPADQWITDGYAHQLACFEKGGDWDTVENDNTLLSAAKIWESFIAQHYVVPLLRKRLETEHKAFRTTEGFFELFSLLRPPVAVTDGKIAFVDVPAPVQDAWWKIAFAGQFIMSIADSSTLRCPRAWSGVPGLGEVEFSRENSCDDYIELGCGSFNGTTPIVTPPCYFLDMLKSYGFVN